MPLANQLVLHSQLLLLPSKRGALMDAIPLVPIPAAPSAGPRISTGAHRCAGPIICPTMAALRVASSCFKLLTTFKSSALCLSNIPMVCCSHKAGAGCVAFALAPLGPPLLHPRCARCVGCHWGCAPISTSARSASSTPRVCLCLQRKQCHRYRSMDHMHKQRQTPPKVAKTTSIVALTRALLSQGGGGGGSSGHKNIFLAMLLNNNTPLPHMPH